MSELKYVDVNDYIWNHNSDEYASWVLMHFRLPALQQSKWKQYYGKYKLFCTYDSKRYRCTGASRLGDVWLTSDFNQEQGYELRVDINDCNEWEDK